MKVVDNPPMDARFWDALFAQGRMPWDRSKTPDDLARYLAIEKSYVSKDGLAKEGQCKRDSKSVFIPGCGAAYEVVSFIDQGYCVTAMDYSQEAVNLAKAKLGGYADSVQHGDVFEARFSQPFDVIYERAFLAALPRDKWADYFRMVNRLLPSGGYLIGYFVISDEYCSRFPPFCLRSGELPQWLATSFSLQFSSRVEDSVAVFKDKEYWMVWKKY